MVTKVITTFDSSKASSPDYIPVVVLRKCEPEFSYILAELFNMHLKESCFVGRFHLWFVHVIRMLVGLLIMLRDMFSFLISSMVFRSSWSTTDLVTVVSDRTVRAFQSSWVTRAVVFWYIQDFQQGVACRSSSKLKS